MAPTNFLRGTLLNCWSYFIHRCAPKGTAHQLTDNDRCRNGKAHLLALSRRNRLSDAIMLQSSPRDQTESGTLLKSSPLLGFFLFPFLPQVISFSWEPCLNKTLMQKSSSQVCSRGAQPGTLSLHKRAIRKHEARLLLLHDDKTFKNTSQFKIAAFSTV